jgi:hypothetical protein
LKAELFSLNRLLSGERLAAKKHMTRALLEPAAFAGKPKKLLAPAQTKKSFGLNCKIPGFRQAR